MKLISWNVNGLRAIMGKNFMEFFNKADADIFCLQETKLQEGQIDMNLPGYHQYWNYAEKKRLLRDGDLYEKGAEKCDIRNRYRRARPGGARDNAGV